MRTSIRTAIFSLLTTALAFSAVTYYSCKPDKCKTTRCAYGGVCRDGICQCQSGYEGSQCETVIRDKFLGVWSVTEFSSMTEQPRNYTISIGTGANLTDISLHNFYNLLTKDAYAIVKGDSFTIGSQTIEGRTIIGYGYLDHDPHYKTNTKMIIRYAVTIDSSGQIDDYGLYPALMGKESLVIKSN
jgi:hypothetical protein